MSHHMQTKLTQATLPGKMYKWYFPLPFHRSDNQKHFSDQFCTSHWASASAAAAPVWLKWREKKNMWTPVLISLVCLLLPEADGILNYNIYAQGMQLEGDFSLAGLFPLHYSSDPDGLFPRMDSCNTWVLRTNYECLKLFLEIYLFSSNVLTDPHLCQRPEKWSWISPTASHEIYCGGNQQQLRAALSFTRT